MTTFWLCSLAFALGWILRGLLALRDDREALRARHIRNRLMRGRR